jgi:hypothetical protein
MTVETLERLIKQADSLTVDEQLRLATHLVERARESYRAVGPSRKWRTLRGMVRHPLLGEDAQTWVSRTRREADEQRSL